MAPTNHNQGTLALFRLCQLLQTFSMKGLPTAMEPAQALFQHVFRAYGIPGDIVSDRGTQFTSQVWKTFCRAARH